MRKFLAYIELIVEENGTISNEEAKAFAKNLKITEEQSKSINMRMVVIILTFLSNKIFIPAIGTLVPLLKENPHLFFKKLLILVRKIDVVLDIIPLGLAFP